MKSNIEVVASAVEAIDAYKKKEREDWLNRVKARHERLLRARLLSLNLENAEYDFSGDYLCAKWCGMRFRVYGGDKFPPYYIVSYLKLEKKFFFSKTKIVIRESNSMYADRESWETILKTHFEALKWQEEQNSSKTSQFGY
jgi:hypothetical protein